MILNVLKRKIQREYVILLHVKRTLYKTSGQSNLTFKPHHRRRQTVQSYLPGGDNVPSHESTHWRHLANTLELMLTSAYLSSQHKRRIDRFSCFCTPHGRKSLYCKLAPLFPKIALSHGDLDPHLIHDSFGPSKFTTQTASRSVQPFCRAH